MIILQFLLYSSKLMQIPCYLPDPYQARTIHCRAREQVSHINFVHTNRVLTFQVF